MDAFEAEEVRRVRRRLLEFYDTARRELPWRGEEDPYRIWVSEVMLQQTRVETVVPYYRRWVERFPDVGSLADADRDEVLQLWKGLGYYRRARNLHRAAGVVRERYGGALPETVRELKELPGVGDYTAGAVASIAFDEPVPAVDGNVRRVLSRLFDLSDPSPSGLRERADALQEPERPGDFNQALMELGARVCTPSSPECGACPVSDHCLARARGTVAERPPPRRRTRVREAEAVVVVAVDGRGRTLVRRRPEDGLLGGMWEFPAGELIDAGEAEGADGGGADDALRVGAEAGALVGEPGAVRSLEPVDHAFTHLKVRYRPYLVRVDELGSGKERGEPPGNRPGEEGAGEPVGADGGAPARVLPLGRLDAVPLSVAQQEIAERARRALASEGDPPPE